MRGIKNKMNILSVLSIVIFTAFFIRCSYYIKNYDKEVLYIPISMVGGTLGWWSLCSSFFFMAGSKDEAWFWHKFGSIGWIGYVSATSYYFFVATHYDKKINKKLKILIFLIIPSALIIRTFFFKGSPLAVDLVQSISGYGWTYINKLTSLSFWAYFFYTNGYLGYTAYIIMKWSSVKEVKWRKKWAFLSIAIDVVVLAIGYITDCIQPFVKPYFPPIANVGTLILLIFYSLFMNKNYEGLKIDNAASADVIFQTVTEPIFLINELGEIIKVNKAAVNMFKISESELLQNKLRCFYENPLDLDCMVNDILLGRSIQGKEAKIFDKNNNSILTMVSANLALNKVGDILGIIVVYRDITHLKHVEYKLRISNKKNKELAMKYYNLANIDMLTKLPNRRYFFHNANHAELNYKNEGRDFAIIYCDVDRFKHINDKYGHKMGDKLLVTIANKLNLCKGKNDFVARIGGDEFVILIDKYSKIDEEVIYRIEELEYEFRQDIIIDNIYMDVGISFGTAIYSEYNDINKMLENADKCMYNCKKKNRIKVINS